MSQSFNQDYRAASSAVEEAAAPPPPSRADRCRDSCRDSRRRCCRERPSRSTNARGEDEEKEADRKLAYRGKFVSIELLEKTARELREGAYGRRGGSLELVFLAFFIAFAVVQSVYFDTSMYVERTLINAVYPLDTLNGSRLEGSFEFGFPGGQSQFWDWANRLLYPAIYSTPPAPDSNPDFGGLRLGNSADAPLALWGVRFRAVRVNPQPCGAACTGEYYPAFSEANEAQADSPFGVDPDGNEYVWHPSPVTGDVTIHGNVASYPGSGFTATLGLNATQARAELLAMQRSGFLGPATRALVVTVTALFPNSGTVTYARLLVEVGNGGILDRSWSVSSAAFYSPEANTVYALAVVSSILSGLIVLLALSDTVFMLRRGLWDKLWALCFDFAACGVFVAQYVFVAQMFGTAARGSPATEEFESFLSAGPPSSARPYYSGSGVATYTWGQSLLATSLILSSMRLFRYTRWLPRVERVHRTLHGVAVDALVFFVVLFIMSVGFVLCGLSLFSSQAYNWSLPALTIRRTLAYLAGDIDYYHLANTMPFGEYSAPLFVTLFIAVFIWYMNALFISIVFGVWRRECAADAAAAERDRLAFALWSEKRAAEGATPLAGGSPVAVSPTRRQLDGVLKRGGFWGGCRYLCGREPSGWLSYRQILVRLRVARAALLARGEADLIAFEALERLLAHAEDVMPEAVTREGLVGTSPVPPARSQQALFLFQAVPVYSIVTPEERKRLADLSPVNPGAAGLAASASVASYRRAAHIFKSLSQENDETARSIASHLDAIVAMQEDARFGVSSLKT